MYNFSGSNQRISCVLQVQLTWSFNIIVGASAGDPLLLSVCPSVATVNRADLLDLQVVQQNFHRLMLSLASVDLLFLIVAILIFGLPNLVPRYT